MWKSEDKKLRKACYIEITKKKKKIIVKIFLEENYCGQPIRVFEFRNTDTFILDGIYTDIILQDYENSYS